MTGSSWAALSAGGLSRVEPRRYAQLCYLIAPTRRIPTNKSTTQKTNSRIGADRFTFYFLFRSEISALCPCSAELVSHDGLLESFPQSLRTAPSGLPPVSRYFSLLSKGKYKYKRVPVILFVARGCAHACDCVRACVLSVPLRPRCLLHSTGTPTLGRYIVDIRSLTSSNPLIHNIVRVACLALGPL